MCSGKIARKGLHKFNRIESRPHPTFEASPVTNDSSALDCLNLQANKIAVFLISKAAVADRRYPAKIVKDAMHVSNTMSLRLP